jgi:hypothetical protein
MIACPVSFFIIADRAEGFYPTWNDSQCDLYIDNFLGETFEEFGITILKGASSL